MADINKNCIWLETNKTDDLNYRSYYFQDPVKVIKLIRPEDLEAFFLNSMN